MTGPGRRILDTDPHGKDGLRAEQLFLVLNIIKHASRTTDPPTFFRLLVDTIYREVKTFSHVSIFEWDPDRRRITAMATAGEGSQGGSAPGASLPAGAIAEAIRTGAAYLSNNLSKEARGAAPVATLSRSALCIPICAGDRILALLNIESRETNVFSPPDVALFEILCENLANFLHGITLFEQVRRKSLKIQNIVEVCRRVFSANSLQEALDMAVRAVVEEYGYDSACVALVSEDGKHLIHKAHHAKAAATISAGYRQEIQRGIAGQVVREGRAICVNDVARDPDYVALFPDARAELCMPLRAGATLVGVLDVNAREVGAFDDEDISLLETLSGQLALAIERTRYLEQTIQTRDYLESLIAGAGDGIMALDLSGRITRWNQGMERILGYPAAEIQGMPYRDVPSHEPPAALDDLVQRVVQGEILEEVEQKGLTRDGRLVTALLTLSPIRDAVRAIVGVSIIVRDVTERRRMEEDFRLMHQRILESEGKFLDVVEKARDAIFFVDTESGLVVQANATAEAQTVFPRTELLGRTLLELHPEGEHDRVRQQFERTLSTGAGPSAEMLLSRKQGPALPVEVTSSIMRYGGRNVVQWFCRDISERRRAQVERETLQMQLLQSEKLSAIGQLISGVAHELNNPLTGVIGYSQLLSASDCDPRIKRGLEKVYAEARRSHRIVQNLLTFARKHPPEKSWININDVIESTIELRSYQLRVDNITIEKNLAPDLPRTMGDFHQLQQVFMNIVSNAHQAIKEKGEGDGLIMFSSRLAQGMIRVEITDNGPGIPPESLPRIFDPFFTTKPTGHGTGLGLSIGYGIVQEHDGRIAARSEAGGRTTFCIDLPVLAQPEGSAAEAARDEMAEGIPEGGAAPLRLLVVDDEPSIVEVLSEALRSCGHSVDTAVNGKLALRMLEKAEYDGIISDLKMPGMSGQELFRHAGALRPGLAARFVFATGDVVNRDTQVFLETSGRPWVEKPFELGRVIRLLTEAAEAPGDR